MHAEAHAGPQPVVLVIDARSRRESSVAGVDAAPHIDYFPGHFFCARIPGLQRKPIADGKLAYVGLRHVKPDQQRAAVIERCDQRIRSNAITGVHLCHAHMTVERRPDGSILESDFGASQLDTRLLKRRLRGVQHRRHNGTAVRRASISIVEALSFVELELCLA